MTPDSHTKMKAVCSYHPTRPAQWDCPKCRAKFCAACIDKRVVDQYGRMNTYYFCPKCNVETRRTAFEDTVVPFWNRLPRFFTYPFHPHPLGLIAVLCVVGAIFSGPSLFSALMRFVTWAVVLKYSFAGLRSTAQGNMVPPKISSDTISAEFDIVFKQIGIYLIVGFVSFKVIQTAGILIGLAFLCFAALSIPAMIIVLAGTNSLVSAVNPMIFAPMAWRIGWSYLLMYFFLMLLAGGPAVLGQHIIAHLPAFLHGLLLQFAKSYYTIISYQLMGYIIFQYHEDIGYHVDMDDEAVSYQDETPVEAAQNETLNRVNVLVKEGKIDDAISVLRSERGRVASEIDLAERYYNLLKLKQLIPEMLQHAEAYLDLLANADRKDKLREVYSECASKNAGFTPGPVTLLKIASALNEAGKHKEAVNSYNRFVKANPKSPLIPKAYFLASNIINEKLNNPGKAAGILKALIKKYPDHEITPYAREYLTKINIP
jgi:tetratricopeptide (TPR) repeat protein